MDKNYFSLVTAYKICLQISQATINWWPEKEKDNDLTLHASGNGSRGGPRDMMSPRTMRRRNPTVVGTGAAAELLPGFQQNGTRTLLFCKTCLTACMYLHQNLFFLLSTKIITFACLPMKPSISEPVLASM
jgi:hypothetical protein